MTELIAETVATPATSEKPKPNKKAPVAPKSQVGEEGQPGPRGQQDQQGPGPAEAGRWRHSQRAHESYGLAATFRARLPFGHDRQENGPDCDVYQKR
jgi:hypothetical protein